MNDLYYEKRLAWVQRCSFGMELVTAATASGSGLASVAVVQAGPGRIIWQALAVVAAVVAVIRPIYAPGKMIEALTRQQQGYRANFFALKKLASDLRFEAVLKSDHRRQYDAIYKLHVELSKGDESPVNRRVLATVKKLVEKELSPDQFWWPETRPAGLSSGSS